MNESSGKLVASRTPELIAAEINSIKEQTKRMVLYNSIEIGRRLIEAKELVAHGEWGEWLERSVDYSQRTANNLMKIFQEYGSSQITLLGDNSKSQAFANLSYSQAVALLGIPSEDRENFIKKNDVDSMSTRELQKAIKEKDQAIKEKEKAEKEAQKALEEKQKIEADVKKLQENLKSEKKKSEKQITKLEATIENTKKQLEQAEAAGNNADAEKLKDSLSKTENDLIDAHHKIEELEQQLKERPIEVAATIEKIPEETEKELQELRKKVEQSQNGENLIKFKICFEKTVASVKDLLVALAEIKEVSEEEYDKYRRAASGLINKMLEKL